MADNMIEQEAEEISLLIRSGALVPVQVFGAEDGFGLCDRFSKHAAGGSDCNRAEWFLLRPSDEMMNNKSVRAALRAVLDDDSVQEPPPWRT